MKILRRGRYLIRAVDIKEESQALNELWTQTAVPIRERNYRLHVHQMLDTWNLTTIYILITNAIVFCLTSTKWNQIIKLSTIKWWPCKAHDTASWATYTPEHTPIIMKNKTAIKYQRIRCLFNRNFNVLHCVSMEISSAGHNFSDLGLSQQPRWGWGAVAKASTSHGHGYDVSPHVSRLV